MGGIIHHSNNVISKTKVEKRVSGTSGETVNTFQQNIITNIHTTTVAVENYRRENNDFMFHNDPLKQDEKIFQKELTKTKLHSLFETVDQLDASLTLSRIFESEQWLRYSALKAQKATMIDDLRKANKLNKNMLNLFRQNVTDIRIGNADTLPEPLKREVQRIWHRKYDDLLKQNEKLKKDIVTMNAVVEERNEQINILERKLLNMGEHLIEREEVIKRVCTKYMNLKKRKDEEEVLLRGSIETLQDELRKIRNANVSSKSGIHLSLDKDAQLAMEIRRGDRLVYENALLRAHLQEAKRACKSSRSSSALSLQKCSSEM
ncbi:PREDICTED: uncharacterized protein LOC107066954 [Polistes dominula]|uniref:Uncharacterized protein LOC107066954 n=1 Tax=Polistes dominula TaxID=743375 RepID=A0ABM1IBC7_POLDO|nr:PREDICTED: uncharacterized protein LOC107066954 [Polistes dominula]